MFNAAGEAGAGRALAEEGDSLVLGAVGAPQDLKLHLQQRSSSRCSSSHCSSRRCNSSSSNSSNGSSSKEGAATATGEEGVGEDMRVPQAPEAVALVAGEEFGVYIQCI